MSSLKQRIAELANEFAANVLREIKRASLEEILAETAGSAPKARKAEKGAKPGPKPAHAKKSVASSGRLPRRSQADIDRAIESIVALVNRHAQGLRADQIQEALGGDPRAVSKPLSDALSKGLIAKRGNKRSTVYLPKK